MTNIQPPDERYREPPATERRMEESAKGAAGGSTLAAIGGAGAVVLTILGLVGILPQFMVSISIIAVGVALMSFGAAIAARSATIYQRMNGGSPQRASVAGGTSAEFLGGAAAVVLGILALIGVAPELLIPISAIVLGGSLLLSGGTAAETYESGAEPRDVHIANETVRAAAGAQTLVGIGAAALGILGLIGVGAGLTLSLVAVLGVGGAILLGSSAFAGKMAALLRH